MYTNCDYPYLLTFYPLIHRDLEGLDHNSWCFIPRQYEFNELGFYDAHDSIQWTTRINICRTCSIYRKFTFMERIGIKAQETAFTTFWLSVVWPCLVIFSVHSTIIRYTMKIRKIKPHLQSLCKGSNLKSPIRNWNDSERP